MTTRMFLGAAQKLTLAGLCASLGMAGCGGGKKHRVPDESSAGAAGADSGACRPGTQGCPCDDDDSCTTTADGETLACEDGMCESDACKSGATGCVCRRGTECDSDASTCKSGKCISKDCSPGERDCTCKAGSCSVGSQCVKELCVDSTGYEGGKCFDNKRCNVGYLCDVQQNVCRHCELGSLGCACTEQKTCGGGLVCSAGTCVGAGEVPPENPECYTPCQGDVRVSDSDIRVCDSDGLVSGCLDGLVCTNGSCLKSGESKPVCNSTTDCPFFQVCLQGGCYSNCRDDASSPPGYGCYKKALRKKCARDQVDDCAREEFCDITDGTNGYCRLRVSTSSDTSSAPTANARGKYTLSTDVLAMTNTRPSGEFRVDVDSDLVQKFTVRRLWHRVHHADGRVERWDASPQNADLTYPACSMADKTCPLYWLKIGKDQKTDEMVEVAASSRCDKDQCPVVQITNAGGVAEASGGEITQWEGAIEVQSNLGKTQVSLSYAQRPEGQWLGAAYYFANFGTEGLENWLNGDNKADASSVKNGLLQRWAALRKGRLSEGWQEFAAVLSATRNGSWRQPEVQKLCEMVDPSPSAACYPFTNRAGVRVLVQDLNSAPIPSGVSELPIAFNLKTPNMGEPTCLVGRVDSAVALQYPAFPSVSLKFAQSPENNGECLDGGGSDCLIMLSPADEKANRFGSLVSGRYDPGSLGVQSCQNRYLKRTVPWLPNGFAGSPLQSGASTTHSECFGVDGPIADSPEKNAQFAAANPIADGRPMVRSIRFLDGALVNQRQLFLLFEEKLTSFIPTQPDTTAYGYMLLTRSQSELKDEDYVGSPPQYVPSIKPVRNGVTCDNSIFEGFGSRTDDEKVSILLNGTSATTNSIARYDNTNVHYLCGETGVFDTPITSPQSSTDTTGKTEDELRKLCLPGNTVRYFRVKASASGSVNPGGHTCNATGNCESVLNEWKSQGLVETDLAYDCRAPDYTAPCNFAVPKAQTGEPQLVASKNFLATSAATSSQPQWLSLRNLIDSAFRYKTRFLSTKGTQLGFVPEKCSGGVPNASYCYDEREIEQARKRIDCLVSYYSNPSKLKDDSRVKLNQFLRGNFAKFQSGTASDGFERLYAELLIMLGDQAFTTALSSRYKGVEQSFPGLEFEKGGPQLEGVNGYEMSNLYSATQHYQVALDRLYSFGADMGVALGVTDGVVSENSFVSPATVTYYLDRLIQAGAKKAAAWGEIAKRYQRLGRTELSRSVAERAFASAYLESATLSRLMLNIQTSSGSVYSAQIASIIDSAAHTYNVAMLDLREAFASANNNVDYFGYSPNYVPLPTPSAAQGAIDNEVEWLIDTARKQINDSRTRDDVAVSTIPIQRQAEAQFKSQLNEVKNLYENQLVEICGKIPGTEYPAIPKYASLSEKPERVENPCGVSNKDSKVYIANAALQGAGVRLQAARLHHANIIEQINIELKRSSDQCALINKQADLEFDDAGTTSSLQREIANSQLIMSGIDTIVDIAKQAAQANQPLAAIGNEIAIVAIGAGGIAKTYVQDTINTAEQNIRNIQANSARRAKKNECTALTTDSEATVARLRLEMHEAELDALRVYYEWLDAAADLSQLGNLMTRLIEQQEQATQLALDSAAAQYDPDLRVFQNSAVLNAEVAFENALRTTFEATRAYEYYTSQSYAGKEKLFLIRTPYNGLYGGLDGYISQLAISFNDFQKDHRTPQKRIAVLSMVDHILKIPRTDSSGKAYSVQARADMMRQKLTDAALFEPSTGTLRLPFSTEIARLSPLTRNHKISKVEAEFLGTRLGDAYAHVGLAMKGTSAIRALGEENRIDYYVLPERRAVINVIAGPRMSTLGEDYYPNIDLASRPFANSHWELQFDRWSDDANTDVDLQSLEDIKLYIYYTDFAE